MGTKWNKYNRCPYCGSRRIRIKNKQDETWYCYTWYCLKCEKEWNGKETLSQNLVSSNLSDWSNNLPDDSWIVFKNDSWKILGDDFYFQEFNPSRRDSK